MAKINADGTIEIKPDEIFRPNLAAEIDDTRTWVSPDGYRLSDRLWLAGQRDRQQIDAILQRSLAKGLSPLQTAQQVEYLLNPYYQPRRDPDTFRILPKGQQPPGVVTTTPRQGPGKGPERPRNSGLGSYAARRLARTETTRAFGAATLRAAEANPFVRRIRWRLSGHHHDADQCDQNAARSSEGQPRGVYTLDEVPRYPDHPQEMCTLTPYVTDEDIQDAIPRLQRAMKDNRFSPEDLQRPFTRRGRPPGSKNKPKAPAPPAQEQWLEDIAAIKRQQAERFNDLGTIDEAEVRRAGSLVRKNMKPMSDTQQAKLRRIQELDDEYDALGRRMFDDPEYHAKTRIADREADWDRRHKINEERAALRRESANPFAHQVRDAIGRVRPVGSKDKHPFAKGSNNVAKAAVDKVKQWVPREWWERSAAHSAIQSKKVSRAYYQAGYAGRAPQLHVSGYDQAYMESVATHEFGHRMEDITPQIVAAEKSFYERRTAGEPLQQMQKLFPGYGYGAREVARPDKFAQVYSGKDYGGRAYELVSMGIEDTFRVGKAPEWILNDEDYQDFILGVLAIL